MIGAILVVLVMVAGVLNAEEGRLVQTRDWFIAKNGKSRAVAVSQDKGTWSGLVRLRDRPNDLAYRIGGGKNPWSGLQLRVDPASGTPQLVREWKIDQLTGIPTYRDFLTTETLPGITYLTSTLPDNGDWVVLPKRTFFIDAHNYENEAGEVADGVFRFTDQIQARYAGFRNLAGLGKVEIIEKRDYYGGPGNYEEYWFGRLEDGTVLGIVRWIAPGFNPPRDELATSIVDFTNLVAFKCLIQKATWVDAWVWPVGAVTSWVPEPEQVHYFRSVGGGTIPTPNPSPPPPNPTPNPVPVPPEYGDDIVIKAVDLDRILAEEAQRFIEDLRSALIR